MLLLAHTLTGVVIGASVQHPAAAFGLGIFSHFALDALPHWNYPLPPYRLSLRSILRISPDLACSLLIAVAAFASYQGSWLGLAVGIVGAALPDALTLTRYNKTFRPIVGPLQRIHDNVQYELPFVPGIFFQICYCALLLSILLTL